MHKLLEALGTEIPRPQEGEVLARLLRDNLFTLRCQDAMLEFFGEAVLHTMNPLERGAMLKRLGLGPKEKPKAVWGFIDGEFTGGKPGEFALKAECQGCHNVVYIQPPRAWSETDTKTNPKTGAVVSQRNINHPVTRAMAEQTLDRCV